MLGMVVKIVLYVCEEDLCEGDVYLFCLDGFNDLVGDCDIEVIVDILKINLLFIVSYLVQFVNDNGGYDNVIVVLVWVFGNVVEVVLCGWFVCLFGCLVY